MIGVYKITNPSNKVYVGQSTDIEKRFLGYRKMKCKQQIKLFNSFRKYGVDSHKFEIIVECEVNELNNLERHYQEFYNVIGEKGLNLKLTKTDDRSGFMSKETKEKMSFSSLGNTISEDAKKKISESKLGVKNPMFGKFGNTHPTFGIKKSKEIKEKMSIERKGAGNPNIKIIINLQTGLFHYGIKEVAETYGYTCAYIGNRLRGSIYNETPFVYV